MYEPINQFFFFPSRRRHTRSLCEWSSDVCSSDLTAAHAVWLDADDIARMGDRGASVAHNPGSNMRLGSGIAPARRMLSAGVHLGIGTDAASCARSEEGRVGKECRARGPHEAPSRK